MVSMTGYGKATAQTASGAWLVECSSVNRKQLEVVLQGPRETVVWEPKIRQEVAKQVARGRVIVAITSQAREDSSTSNLSTENARQAWKNLEEIRTQLGIHEPVSLDQLLRHPLMTKGPGSTFQTNFSWEVFQEALEEALEEMNSMRRKEGQNLAIELCDLLDKLEDFLQTLQELAPGVPIRHRTLLESRLQAAGLFTLPDPSRLATEVALFADRCDVTEELARLKSHLSQFRQKMADKRPVGRTLEFLVQEMMREINTTGAKANDSGIAQLVVEAKSTLDKLREQLTNIE